MLDIFFNLKKVMTVATSYITCAGSICRIHRTFPTAAVDLSILSKT